MNLTKDPGSGEELFGEGNSCSVQNHSDTQSPGWETVWCTACSPGAVWRAGDYYKQTLEACGCFSDMCLWRAAIGLRIRILIYK